MSLNTRRDPLAVLRHLNPVRPEAPDSNGARQRQNTARLLALATSHPRIGSSSNDDATARNIRGGFPRIRRSALVLTLAGACVAGGGAVAIAGGWQEITTAWARLGGEKDHYRASVPQLVASGAGINVDGPTTVRLWVAPARDGGQCASIRATGFSLDTCRDGIDQPPVTLIPGLRDASYQIIDSPNADYLYGRVDAQQVGTLTLSTPGRQPVDVAVDPVSGYWVTSIFTTSSDLTLTATNHAGQTVISHLLTH